MTDDPRVARILGDWQRARDAGSAPDPEDVVAAHPDLAAKLRAGFEMVLALDRVYAAGADAPRDWPEQLGPYKLVRELGAGGMGTVYEARVVRETSGLDVGSSVALKVVHSHLLARAGFFKRFLREAEAGRRVRHQRVVSTYEADARDVDGKTHLYLVMEYVEGRTLRELLDDLGVVPEALVREIALQLAEGLAGIHEQGIVHRDLKPDNVIITPDHEIRIMDMGVARMDDESALTEHGQFAGTLQYAAPEQIDAADVGPAADLYSLGVLLYELVTGDNPFRRDDAGATIRAHLEEAPQRVDERDPELSRFLGEVLATLLAKQSDQRFESAELLGSVLADGERSVWWTEREQALLKSHPRLPTVPVRRETTLHGREEQLALLNAAWQRAREGTGQVILLEGEAGIGKSRLVDAFLRDLDTPDAHVLYGSYPPTGGDGAITGAIREHFGTHGLADALRPYLTITPGLVEPLACLLRHEPPPDGAPSLAGDALHAVLVHLMRALAAEKPLIWVIEDLHFASEDSQKVVLSLARAVEGHPVHIIATTRPGLSEDLLVHLGRVEGLERSPVGRLSPREVVELLEDAFHSPMLAEKLGGKIALASDGVPFFVFEMIRGLREGQLITQLDDGTWVETQAIDRIEVPPAVRDLVEARLRGLTNDERALLDVGAVIGFEFDPDLVARVRGRRRLDVLEALAGIERRLGVVRGEGRSFRFDHHQIEEVLYQALHESLREEYHAATAEALETRADATETDPKDLEGALCVDLCKHYLKGVRGESALRYLEAAQAQMRKGYLNAQLIALSELALAVPDLLVGTERVQALLRLAGAFNLLGRHTREEDCALEAKRLAGAADDDPLRGRAANALGRFFWFQGRLEEANVQYERGLSIARDVGDPQGEAMATGNLGNVLFSQGRLKEAQEHFERSLTLLREAGNRQSVAVFEGSLGNVLLAQGHPQEAQVHHQRSLEMSREIEDRTGEARALGNLGMGLWSQGRVNEAQERYEQQLKVSREIGLRAGEAMAMANQSSVLFVQGRFEEAGEQLERSLAIMRETGNRQAEAFYMGSLGNVFLSQGLLDQAQQCQQRHLAMSREIGDRAGEVRAMGNVGVVLLSQGRLEEAQEHIEQGRVLSRELGDPQGEMFALHNLGGVLRERGDRGGSEESLLSSLALSAEIGHRHTGATTLLALGSLRARTAGGESGRQSLVAARDAAAEMGIVGTEVLARCELALLPGGDPRDALGAFAEHEGRLGAEERRDARLLLFRATGDRTHLVDAKRLLDEALAGMPEEHHEAMCRNLRVNRKIMEAWRAEFGDADVEDVASSAADASESETSAG